MKRFANIAVWLLTAFSLLSTSVTAQEPPASGSNQPVDPLRRLELRLDELERENRAIRAENARLLGQPNPGAASATEPRIPMGPGTVIPAQTPPSVPPATRVPPFAPDGTEPRLNEAGTAPDGRALLVKPNAGLSYTPGEGATISMLNDTSRLTIGATLSGLGIFSTSRPFASGLPLLLDPRSPTGQASNTFDLHGRQSSIDARFSGPEVLGLTPGAEILAFFFNDTITNDNYGLLVYYAYGELKNDQMRFAAGLQRDIFNPVGPTVIPMSYLYGSGNAGSYRGQIRFERYCHYDDGSQLTFQFGLSEPISTLVRNSLKDPLVEDNGFPNLESRVAFGGGEIQEFMGGRKQRPVEFGVSGVVGQIRITRVSPGAPVPERIVDNVWGLGCDLQWAVTDRLGVKAEAFVGQTLGEYNAGVLQNYNAETFRPIRTRGGYGEIYYYLNPKVHVHCGYGIDNPTARDLAPGQIACNQTFFNTFFWDVSKTFQIAFEVDYRKTNYTSPLIDATGVNFVTQFLWRF